MTRQRPDCFSDPLQLADAIIERVGPRIVLALPLGLGKANHVANALYARAAADSGISLQIYTALTLETPHARSELEKRFLAPLHERFFSGYPALEYATALRQGDLPENISVHEFFLMPGRWLNNASVQQAYQSVNYTHVLHSLLEVRVNVLAQLIAPGPETDGLISLSCNPDLSVDLLEARKNGAAELLVVGQLNRNLPYLQGDAERPINDFDLLLDGEEFQFPLFKLPQEPVSVVDHAIGLHTASLIPDGGTLQIGIGSIGDAICHALLLRHRENALFSRLIERLEVAHAGAPGHREPFQEGLYAASEMLVEGFLPLLEAGLLKREVDGIVLHAGFFLASPRFYETLAQLPDSLRAKIAMMRISFINELSPGEQAKRQARREARFINSAMMATLGGGVVSDGLDNGQVVSGVGGQYNFVAMAFALDGARSVITLPATRTSRGTVHSNILWSYGHLTIPRHLRDIVVTEYGIADLRYKTDAEVIAALLEITDSRFQNDLLKQAKAAGKIAKEYRIPASCRQNTPERLAEKLRPAQDAGMLPPFPLGSDFTAAEEQLLPALERLQQLAGAKTQLLRLILRGWRLGAGTPQMRGCLERMGLLEARSLREKIYRALLLATLTENR